MYQEEKEKPMRGKTVKPSSYKSEIPHVLETR